MSELDRLLTFSSKVDSTTDFVFYWLPAKAQKPWAKRYEKLVKCKKDYHLACKLERTANNQENNARNSTEFSPDQVSLPFLTCATASSFKMLP